ncbi:MAG: PKD domain-containing protein [Actinomycetota bacterium]
MNLRGFFLRMHARLHRDERGFTVIEAMVAGMVLAIGSFAVASSLSYGLDTTGLARQRLAAQATAEQEIEYARSLNYESVVLDANVLTHSSNTDNPDYWVSTDGLSYDPTETGAGAAYEPLILDLGANPSLDHFQDPVLQGNTNFKVYDYVTWVDSPTDGTVGGAGGDGLDGNGDGVDGNGDGVSDANGHDQKRVTVVVTWANSFGSLDSQLKMSTVISDGKVPYHDPSAGDNLLPVVSCPVVSGTGLAQNFEAQGASDPDGGTVTIDWDFGDGTPIVPDGGVIQSHTYSAAGTYYVELTVEDDESSTATSGKCEPPLTVSSDGGPVGGGGPTGTVSIASGQTYTTTSAVTLTLSSTGATTMQFSNDDGTTWGSEIAYSAAVLYTLSPTGEGTRTVSVRFLNSGGEYGATASDSIIVDTTVPAAPTTLDVCCRPANGKEATLTWSASSTLLPPSGDLAGYQIWRRPTPAGAWSQVTNCAYIPASSTSCVDPGLTKTTNYEYYVVAVDVAGNVSAESPHDTV